MSNDDQVSDFFNQVDAFLTAERWPRLTKADRAAVIMVLFNLGRLGMYQPHSNSIMHLYYMRALESSLRQSESALPKHLYEKASNLLEDNWRLREMLGLDNYLKFDLTKIAPFLANDAAHLKQLESRLSAQEDND